MLTLLLLPFVCLMNFLNTVKFVFFVICYYWNTCLAQSSASGWTNIFLKCLESVRISPRLHQRVLCVCWGMLSIIQQAAYSSALAFNSCLYRASRSVRGGRFRPSRSFLSIGPVCPCAWPSSILGIWQSFSKPTVNISLPSFCFEVLGQLFVCPSCFSKSGMWDVK